VDHLCARLNDDKKHRDVESDRCRALEEAIAASKAVIVLVGPHGLAKCSSTSGNWLSRVRRAGAAIATSNRSRGGRAAQRQRSVARAWPGGGQKNHAQTHLDALDRAITRRTTGQHTLEATMGPLDIARLLIGHYRRLCGMENLATVRPPTAARLSTCGVVHSSGVPGRSHRLRA
jgi:hypothetical protein